MYLDENRAKEILKNYDEARLRAIITTVLETINIIEGKEPEYKTSYLRAFYAGIHFMNAKLSEEILTLFQIFMTLSRIKIYF